MRLAGFRCWLMGHRYPTVRTDRLEAAANLSLLMEPARTVVCGRCGRAGKARAVVVCENGVDHLEIRPEER